MSFSASREQCFTREAATEAHLRGHGSVDQPYCREGDLKPDRSSSRGTAPRKQEPLVLGEMKGYLEK